MQMPGRKFSTGKEYRYGFNGKESSDEIYSGAISFEARIYDSRIGRFFTTDPREAEYAWQSTYVYFSNSPTSIVDNMGMGGTDPAPAGYYYNKVTHIANWLEENSTISSDQTYLGTEYYVTHRFDNGNSVTYRYKNNVEKAEQVNTNSESSEIMAINNNKEIVGTVRANYNISEGDQSNNGSKETWVDGRGTFHKVFVTGFGGAFYDLARGLWHTFTTKEGFGNMLESSVRAGYSQTGSIENPMPQNATQWGNLGGQVTIFALPFMEGGGAVSTKTLAFEEGIYIPRTVLNQQKVAGIDIPLPNPHAGNFPHTTLGGKVGSDGILYRQSATFTGGSWPLAAGKIVPLSRVDWSSHGRLSIHPNPHQHVYNFNNGHSWLYNGNIPFP